MKSLFLEKSLGMDIREDSVALTLMGKKLRIAEALAGDFIKLKPLTGQDEKAEKHFLNEVNRFLIDNNLEIVFRNKYTKMTKIDPT